MSDDFRVKLFIIGGMKCGTSALHGILQQHPQVAMSRPKEPCYFVDRDTLARAWPSKRNLTGLESYHALFMKSSGTQIYGEASTLYSKLPEIAGVADRIFGYNPHAKILYLVRNPIDRLISQYLHEYRVGSVTEPLMAAVQQHPRFLAYGDYAMQLAPYLDRFPRSQISTVLSERLWERPVEYLEKLVNWLGLGHIDFDLDLDDKARNLTKSHVGRRRSLISAQRLEWLYSTHVMKFAARHIPPSVKGFLRHLIFAKPLRKEALPVADLTKLVRCRIGQDIDAFRRLIDDPIPEWGPIPNVATG